MKTGTEKQRNIRNNGVIDEANYHINPENVTHITAILRNMYSAPELAVIREYAANAIDAHVQMGHPERPIIVTLPTDLSPVFKVRDFGGGLSLEQTKELLYGFGSSGEHKRNSNDQIGGFGIGCKCAFAVADSFTYTVIHGGKKRIWNCYLDELDNGKAILQGETDSTEEAGIEVTIPVDSGDVETFQRYAMHAFRFFATKPDVRGLSADAEIIYGTPAPAAVSEMTLKDKTDGSDWKVRVKFFTEENDLSSYGYDERERLRRAQQELTGGVVMGGIRYAFDWEDCGVQDKITKDGALNYMWANIAKRILIEAPIGWVQLAPNREALQYSKRTKAMFQAMFNAFTIEYMNKLFDVHEDGIPIVTRINRIMTVQELLDGRRSRYGSNRTENGVKLLNECLKKYAPKWKARQGSHYYVGEMYPLDYTGNVDAFDDRDVGSVKHSWALVQSATLQPKRGYSCDTQRYEGYLPCESIHTFKTLASLDGADSAALVGFGKPKRKVLVNFISNEFADELRSTGNDESTVNREKSTLLAHMAYRRMLYGDDHTKMQKAVSQEGNNQNQYDDEIISAATVLTFRVADEEDRKKAIESMCFAAHDTLLYSDEILTELPKGDTLKEYRGYKRKPVQSRRGTGGQTSNGRSVYAQHSAKWFRSNKKDYARPLSGGWDVVADISDLDWENKPDDFEMPVVRLDRFEVFSGDVGIAQSNHDSRKFLYKHAANGMWQQLFGLAYIPAMRSKDYDTLKASGKVKITTFDKLIEEKIIKVLEADEAKLKQLIEYCKNRYDRYGQLKGLEENKARDMMMGWLRSLEGKKLNVSKEFQKVVDEAPQQGECKVKDWLVDTFLDGDDAEFKSLMGVLLPVVSASKGRKVFVKVTEELEKERKSEDLWYADAVLTVLHEVPQAWPLALCDGDLHEFTCITDYTFTTPCLVAGLVITAQKTEEEKKSAHRAFRRNYGRCEVPLKTQSGEAYMKDVVLPSMTTAVIAAETEETE